MQPKLATLVEPSHAAVLAVGGGPFRSREHMREA